MRALRIAAVLTLAGAGLAACSASKPAPASSRPSSAPAGPGEALTRSLSGVDAGRYSFEITFPTTHVVGAVDQADHQAHWIDTIDDQPGRIGQETRVIGSDVYTERTGVPSQAGWRHHVIAGSSPGDDPLATPDVLHLSSLLKSVTATSADGDTIHGTLDLSKFRDPTRDLAMLIAWAQDPPIPVTAQLDAQGRLVELSADLPKGDSDLVRVPAGPFTLKITGYGAAVAPAPRPTGVVTQN